ncbi:NmrA family NAD(P)-binding protein [Pendulispora rubella]|uniref:NmrA family NAD(P)-binding protein n=1 Tax=Pendulispora rubella TaxID=2741070 RepID=A0ABZ2LI18_9BACT
MFAILGATGKVGRATIRMLLAHGYPVRAIVRDVAKAAEFKAAGCEVVVAHLGDKASLEAAFAGTVVAQVICPVLARSDDAFAEMTGAIDTLAEALAAAHAPSIMAISDYGAELPEGTGVTRVFHHLEKRLRVLDAALTFLRSAEHMQNVARFAGYAAETGTFPTMHHPLTKLYPTVSADDVGVIAAELLMETRASAHPRVVHVEGPCRYTPLDVAEALGSIVGREVVARELPRSEWLPSLKRAGIGDSYAQLVVELYDAHNAGRIDAEAGRGEVRRGTTKLRDAVAGLLKSR